jgi:hypothetical protein
MDRLASFKKGTATPTPGSIIIRLVFVGFPILIDLIFGYLILKYLAKVDWNSQVLTGGFAILLLIALVFLLGYIVRNLAGLAWDYQASKKLSERGQVTDGIVVKKWTKGSRRRAGPDEPEFGYFYVSYEFTVNGGKRKLEEQVNYPAYEKVNWGSVIRIQYLPENPDIARMASSEEGGG